LKNKLRGRVQYEFVVSFPRVVNAMMAMIALAFPTYSSGQLSGSISELN